MTTPQHQLLDRINQLLEIADNRELGLVTRMYLADDLAILLGEVEQKVAYKFESFCTNQRIPEVISKQDQIKPLSAIVESEALAQTYIHLLTLQSQLRRDAAQIIADSPTDDNRVSSEQEMFLENRKKKITALHRRAKELSQNLRLPLEHAVDIYTSEGEGDLRLALSEYEHGDLASARSYFETAAAAFLKVAEVNTTDSIWYGKAGLCLLRAQKYEKAISILNTADALCVHEAESSRKVFLRGINNLYRAEAYLKLGRYQEALDDAVLCNKAKPDFEDGYVVQGDALRKLGKVDEAVQSYEQALAITNKRARYEHDFSEYCLAIRAERGLQKLGKSTSTKFEEEAIEEGFKKIKIVMDEYN